MPVVCVPSVKVSAWLAAGVQQVLLSGCMDEFAGSTRPSLVLHLQQKEPVTQVYRVLADVGRTVSALKGAKNNTWPRGGGACCGVGRVRS